MNEQQLEQRLETLRKLVEVQCGDGNWNFNAYMMGLANGLLLAEHIISGRDGDVCYKDTPREWLADRYHRRRPILDEEECSDPTNKQTRSTAS